MSSLGSKPTLLTTRMVRAWLSPSMATPKAHGNGAAGRGPGPLPAGPMPTARRADRIWRAGNGRLSPRAVSEQRSSRQFEHDRSDQGRADGRQTGQIETLPEHENAKEHGEYHAGFPDGGDKRQWRLRHGPDDDPVGQQ